MLTGMRVADRFELLAPGSWIIPGSRSFEARDTRLDVPVVVFVSESEDVDRVVSAATRVRLARDPRLARIIDVGTALLPWEATETDGEGAEAGSRRSDSDSTPDPERRAYVVVERVAGLTASELTASRILPANVAHAFVLRAARALESAEARGLLHGSLTPEAIVVTARGRVLVAGAGLPSALQHDGPSAARAHATDVAMLARFFVRSVTGLVDAAEWEGALPEGLTPAERSLAVAVSHGAVPRTLKALLAALGTRSPVPLNDLVVKMRSFAPTLRPTPPPDEPEEYEEAPGTAVATAKPIAVVGDEELEDWDLELLDERAEELPTVAEAIFEFLHRRFPASEPVTKRLEDAHRRALNGPRIDAARWTVLTLLGVVAVLAIIAVGMFRAPFVPTFDLHNQPPQTYPSFTFPPPSDGGAGGP